MQENQRAMEGAFVKPGVHYTTAMNRVEYDSCRQEGAKHHGMKPRMSSAERTGAALAVIFSAQLQ